MARAAVKAKPLPAAPKIEVFEDIEQGSGPWFQLRSGLLTASNFAVVGRSGKDGGVSLTRKSLLFRIAGERLTGLPAEEGFKSAAMQRGNDMEPEARAYYARTNFTPLRRVGFVKKTLPNGIAIGSSPDSLVGDAGALEIKTMKPELMIAHMETSPGAPPSEHRAQLQGTCWVCDLEWIDIILFYRGMPITPRWRIIRDDIYIKELSDAVEVFEYDLAKIVERVKKMGNSE